MGSPLKSSLSTLTTRALRNSCHKLLPQVRYSTRPLGEDDRWAKRHRQISKRDTRLEKQGRPQSSDPPRPRKKFELLNLSNKLPTPHLYTDTQRPLSKSLTTANKAFYGQAKHLFSTHVASFLPQDSAVPEVILLGRSNVGKSSLLNALCYVEKAKIRLASTSKKSGHTKCLHVYGVGKISAGIKEEVQPGMSKKLFAQEYLGTDSTSGRPKHMSRSKSQKRHINRSAWMRGSGLAIVDTPGYGAGSHRQWGEQVQAYLTGRKQLRRAFLLLDATMDPKKSDVAVARLLLEHGVPLQLIITKCDRILYPGKEARTGKPESENLNKMQLRAQTMRRMLEEGLNRPEPDSSPDGGKEGVVTTGQTGSTTRLPFQDVLCTSTDDFKGAVAKPGISELRWAMLQACGLDVPNSKEFAADIPILEDS